MFSTGVDIVKVNRIREILDTKKDSFYNRVFTDGEIQYLKGRNNDARTVAGLFASKEAISKVLGTGIGKISWRDMEVFHDINGKPMVRFSPKIKEYLTNLNINSIELSISHEEEYAVAIAIGYGSTNYVFNIPEEVKGILPERKSDSHKGTYGRVGIIAGSRGMTGAPYLASMAALRSGSGLVYALVPESLEAIMSIKLTEVIVKGIKDDNKGYFTKNSISDILQKIKGLDGLVIGPGIGVDRYRTEMIKSILEEFNGPVLLDADGINCIAKEPDILLDRKAITIMTPHPGEMATFLGKTIREVQDNRIYYSKYVSDKYNIVTILKGNNTMISQKDKMFINPSGNPGMATAGSGDILAGMIMSFVCQGISPFESSVLGTFAHGLAGDMAKEDKGEYGLTAGDILNYIPVVLKIPEIKVGV